MKNANRTNAQEFAKIRIKRFCDEWQSFQRSETVYQLHSPESSRFAELLLSDLREICEQPEATPPSPSVGAEDVAREIERICCISNYQYQVDIPKAAALIAAHTDAKVAEAEQRARDVWAAVVKAQQTLHDKATKRADGYEEALKGAKSWLLCEHPGADVLSALETIDEALAAPSQAKG